MNLAYKKETIRGYIQDNSKISSEIIEESKPHKPDYNTLPLTLIPRTRMIAQALLKIAPAVCMLSSNIQSTAFLPYHQFFSDLGTQKNRVLILLIKIDHEIVSNKLN